MINPNNFPIGISDFTKVIQKGCIFIDKTMFIKEVMDDKADVTLITRPRRFGKTLNMSMLEAFFSTNGADVFKGLLISKETPFCTLHQNKYPVIFLSFKDCKYSDFDSLFIQIQKVFSNLYEKHSYLLEGDSLSQAQKEVFNNVLTQKISSPSHLSSALFDLISYIKKHRNIKPIVLIDEYDTPIHSSYSHNFYQEIVEFMRILLGSALKDNGDLEKAIMTGIARVAKESMFSGLNNLKCCTILDEQYAQYFGFTQDEVESLLPTPNLIEPIKQWYNGYKIGQFQIYNPWSIIHCLSKDAKLTSYWLGTSDNAVVYDLIGKSDDNFKDKIEKLIKGEPQEQIIYDHLNFQSLDTNPDAVWTLLLHGGYLNVISNNTDSFGEIHTVINIPNKEILSLYLDIVKKWFYLNHGSTFYRDFIKSLDDSNDPSKFLRYIQTYIADSLSYFDLSSKTPEHVFQIFMMGLLVGFRGRYDVDSNGEAGDGRYDVIMTPKDPSQKAIIMEFKVCDDPSKLEKTTQSALIQISDKRYTDAFKGEILAIGMAFCGKKMIGTYKIL